ncbi:hypothetical protein GQ53DRAFT_769957 [Thozetella sp. PMI_491]|nr:hypothetical protein GQ53DRAFT_769957 [Thozetella sp. PMI_491]
MLCMTDPSPHTSRVLRSFRSHKSLKSAARRQPEIQITHVSYNHVHKTSDSSSIIRSSLESDISRPSTGGTDVSSTSSTSTIEWDPLRLHPAMTAVPTAPLPERRSQHELRGARSFQQLSGHHTSFRSLQNTRRSEVEIHEGFDFGFTPATRPAPVSAWSYSASPTPSSVAGSDAGDGPEWGDEHALTPRPLHHYPAGPDSDADYFMKRGGWKRRGIVFTSGITMASDDECFDLEQ